jgi:hypothetical protein
LCLYVPEYSPLWRPFVEFTRPSPRETIVGLYCLVVYLWLAAPIAAGLGRRRGAC